MSWPEQQVTTVIATNIGEAQQQQVLRQLGFNTTSDWLPRTGPQFAAAITQVLFRLSHLTLAHLRTMVSPLHRERQAQLLLEIGMSDEWRAQSKRVNPRAAASHRSLRRAKWHNQPIH